MQTPEQQLAFLQAHNAARMGHTSQSLLDHLTAVRGLLVQWGAPASVAAAGLFHSVYGTESYRQEAVPLELRPQVRAVIGEEAERLAYVFGAMVKDTFDASVERGCDFRVRDRHGGEMLSLSVEEWSALCEVVVANWLEQRPRAPQEYRYLKSEMFREVRRWLSAATTIELDAAYGFLAK